jgi:hypothetical protein
MATTTHNTNGANMKKANASIQRATATQIDISALVCDALDNPWACELATDSGSQALDPSAFVRVSLLDAPQFAVVVNGEYTADRFSARDAQALARAITRELGAVAYASHVGPIARIEVR